MDLLEENSSERIFHAQASELMAVSFLVYINRLLLTAVSTNIPKYLKMPFT